MTKKNVRTRIAPSPTGFAHVGTAYAALFNWAWARKNKGSFVLRIEDTDVERNVAGAQEAIFEGLSWLGIDWDEGPDKGGPHGPYRQSERLETYQEYAKDLVALEKAFEDEGAIRFKNPGDDISWNDHVRGEVAFPGEEVTDFVILRSNGYPVYNFAVVIDDHLTEITHVIRGEEHISNTPRQIALYKAFGWDIPEFAHFPSLRNEQRQKLSKRRDPVDLRFFREEGFLPSALVNFLCLLGWSHPEGKEIFNLEEFVSHFDLKRIRKAGPIFDIKKLEWLNGEYIRSTRDKELAHLVNQFIPFDISEEDLLALVPLIKERTKRLSEGADLLSFFWQRPQVGREMFEDENARLHLSAAIVALGDIKKWDLEQINKALEDVIKKEKFKTGKFYMTLRIALTGRSITPPINESMELLGQDEVLKRLQDVQQVLAGVELPTPPKGPDKP